MKCNVQNLHYKFTMYTQNSTPQHHFIPLLSTTSTHNPTEHFLHNLHCHFNPLHFKHNALNILDLTAHHPHQTATALWFGGLGSVEIMQSFQVLPKLGVLVIHKQAQKDVSQDGSEHDLAEGGNLIAQNCNKYQENCSSHE